MAAYRQALSDGLKPSLKVLDRMLACLRLPYIAPVAQAAPSLQQTPFKVSGKPITLHAVITLRVSDIL